MTRTLLRALTTCAVATVVLFTAPVVANAASSSDTVGTAATCNVQLKESVNLRSKTSTGSTSLGIVPKGKTVKSDCSMRYGGSYTACGKTDKVWDHVYWNGSWGFVASTCIRWV